VDAAAQRAPRLHGISVRDSIGEEERGMQPSVARTYATLSRPPCSPFLDVLGDSTQPPASTADTLPMSRASTMMNRTGNPT
jgi:hypothetical protein